MELVLDVIIALFWTMFFLATTLGVINEYQTNHQNQKANAVEDNRLEDDDPVYIVGP